MQRVLIVDDEEALCWAIRMALLRTGHVVAVASSAEDGVRLAESFLPDTILLDVRLPGAEGPCVMEDLFRITRRAPIIVMTAFGNQTIADQVLASGAFRYLIKPFDLDEVLHWVQKALQWRSRSANAAPQLEDSPAAKTAAGALGFTSVQRSWFGIESPHST